MGAEAIIASVAAVTALMALFLNWRMMQIAARQTDFAREQVALARQIRIDAAQPYVWADIRGDDAQQSLVVLAVGNSGPTVATEVRVEIDPPLAAIDQLTDGARSAQELLLQGLPSLAPGRTFEWALGQGFNLLRDENPRLYRVKICFTGPMGAGSELTYGIDLTAMAKALDKPAGSLHQLTRAVKDLKK